MFYVKTELCILNQEFQKEAMRTVVSLGGGSKELMEKYYKLKQNNMLNLEEEKQD